MAITINGTGSITGISAGGLPDGVITTDDIAASAVTSAKLAAGAAGKILQVVNATYATLVSSSTNTYVDTGLTASITPSSASNKILVTVFQVGLTASYTAYGGLRLVRNTTEILGLESEFAYIFTSGQWNNIGASGCSYLDSPNTTSSVTYKTQFRSSGNFASVEVQRFGNSTITLMEVAA